MDGGDVLPGEPSNDLIEASTAAAGASSGAVAAYCADGIWYYVPAGQEAIHRGRGETVVSVYVEEMAMTDEEAQDSRTERDFEMTRASVLGRRGGV